ncbi:MAG: hypothetical protein ACE5OS_09135 [Anaerolineae bacterium]
MFPFKRYVDHLKRTLLTLGVVLFLAAALGVATEVWLRSAETTPNADQVGPASLGAMLSLALASVGVSLPVVGALVAIPLLASNLLYRLYATKDLKEAHDALNRIVFGKLGRRPIVVIREGKIGFGKDSFAERVGGPATLVIHDDTAVVTEQYGRIKRILGAGIQDVERFEKAWEIIDLRPQRWVYEVFALTKEGIPISCQADISFQIDDQPGNPGWKVHTEGAYPYAEEAVFKAATNKWIREPEREDTFMTWAGRVVIGFTEGLLRNILAEYRLDWLIAPPQPDQKHPREEIRQRLEEGLQERVSRVGAKLLSVEIGAIEVKARDKETTEQLSDIVSKQWIEAWHTDWETRALTSRAEGEAELLRMDMARIQAQADLVVTLTEALQSTVVSQGAIEPYILALRFVEALRWMSYNTIRREFMPPEAMLTLKRLQELLGPEAGKPSEQKEGSQQQEGV